MRAKLLFLTGSVVLTVLAAAAWAAQPGETILVTDDGLTLTRACTGATVVKVMGNENTLTLTGECARVEVLGNENRVIVAAAAAVSVMGNENRVAVAVAGGISVMGNENEVVWERGTGGKDPAISNLGTGNEVTRKAP